MKNKKGDVELLPVLIITLLIIAAGFIIYFRALKPVAEGESNIDAVKSWVWAQAAKKKATVGLDPTSRPPVPYLQEAYYVDNLDQLKKDAPGVMADSVYDCARAFQFGEVNFMDKMDMTLFCFQCRAIVFSEELKKDQKLIGFQEYLRTTKPTASSDTYINIINEKGNKNNFALINYQEDSNTMPISKDLYIYFLATDQKITWRNVAVATALGAGAGAAGGATIGVLGGPIGIGWGAVAGTVGGGATALYKFIAQEDKFRTWIYVAPPEQINQFCNAKAMEEEE